MGNLPRLIVFCSSLCCVFQIQSAEPGRIALDVVVTDSAGTPLAGLQQQDFTLLDNKQPRPILSFDAVQAAGTPVEVLLLIDEVNTAFKNVSYEREQLEKFLQRNGGQVTRPIRLIFLTDAGAAVSNAPTQDGKALAEQLKQNRAGLRTIGRSQGAYGALDRFKLSLHALDQLIDHATRIPGRKLLIWISPGWPLLSGPRVELSLKDQQGLFNSVVSLSDGLRRARITLYSVDPLGATSAGEFQTSYYKSFVKAVKKPSQVEIGNLGLQVLATQTGGRVLYSSNDIAGEIATCIADANSFYVIGFDAVPGDGPNDYHSLELKVGKPGTVARTRAGYYAQP